ncbi:MAG: alpha-L-fucosidase, partial [Panacibacter sp.]
MKRKMHFALFMLLSAIGIQAQTYQPNWQSLDTRPVPEWYRNSKFGIFIHWGVYAVPGFTSKGNYSEWYQYGLEHGDSAIKKYHKDNYGDNTYYQFADHFTADLFNP